METLNVRKELKNLEYFLSKRFSLQLDASKLFMPSCLTLVLHLCRTRPSDDRFWDIRLLDLPWNRLGNSLYLCLIYLQMTHKILSTSPYGSVLMQLLIEIYSEDQAASEIPWSTLIVGDQAIRYHICKLNDWPDYLQFLCLSNTGITIEHLPILQKLYRLKHLDISFNMSIDLDFYVAMSRPFKFKVSSNTFGLSRLQQLKFTANEQSIKHVLDSLSYIPQLEYLNFHLRYLPELLLETATNKKWFLEVGTESKAIVPRSPIYKSPLSILFDSFYNCGPINLSCYEDDDAYELMASDILTIVNIQRLQRKRVWYNALRRPHVPSLTAEPSISMPSEVIKRRSNLAINTISYGLPLGKKLKPCKE
jgi:hypothetical protein